VQNAQQFGIIKMANLWLVFLGKRKYGPGNILKRSTIKLRGKIRNI
jgi:hypothetical protein